MKELVYSIVASPFALGSIPLTLQLKERVGSREIRVLEEGLSFSQWKAVITTSEEREAFLILKEEELLFQKEKTGRIPSLENFRFHTFHITTSNSIFPLLQHLAAAQKLYFQDKSLIVDPYTKVNFYYEILLSPHQQLEVKGRLKWNERSLELKQADFIGNGLPPWFIQGISLKLLPSFLNSKLLQRLLSDSPWILEATDKLLLLQQLEDEGLLPEETLLFRDEQAKREFFKAVSPLPLLVLKDRQGAFAQLWMQYGEHYKILFQDPRLQIRGAKGELLFKRQLEEEKYWEKDLLETDFTRKLTADAHYYCPTDKISKSLSFLLEMGWRIQDVTGKNVVKHSSPHVILDEEASHIAIRGKLHYANHAVDVASVVGMFNRRECFLSLDGQTVGLIPSAWEEPLLKELSEEGEIVGGTLRIKKHAIGTLSTLLEQGETSSSFLLALKQVRGNTPETIPPAVSFQGLLRPYQQKGVDWLFFLKKWGFHGILADEMGLGKTIQILAFLANQSSFPHLIVMPTSLLFNWRNEIRKFLPDYTVLVHQGPKRATHVEQLSPFHIILTSYATLRLDAPLFASLTFETVVLDEAQVIKNPQTQIAQALYALPARFRVCLTGTPIENHLMELWSHFHFLMKELLGSQEAFEKEIATMSADSRHVERLKKKIHPFILRRRKKEVLGDLPERIDQIVWVEMHEKQRQLYEKILKGFKNNLLKKISEEGVKKYRMQIFEALLRLRQVCCHPLLLGSCYVEEDEEKEALTSAKLEIILQDLEAIVENNQKALIYSQFSSMLKILTQCAREKGWSYSYLDGNTKEREAIVTSFQNDPSQSLFFISLKAGGVGLNLTAADHVLIYDPWWNESAEEQAISRTHRMGRKNVVMTKRFLTRESIEEKMLKLKFHKKQLLENVLDAGSGINLEHFSLEELCTLFE